MALYQVTVKKQWFSAGLVIEPGMSVQVATAILADPMLVNGGQLVQEAFLRIYGVDSQEMRALNGYIGVGIEKDWVKVYNRTDKIDGMKMCNIIFESDLKIMLTR